MIEKHLHIKTFFMSQTGDVAAIPEAIYTITKRIVEDIPTTTHEGTTKSVTEPIKIFIHIGGGYSTRFYGDNIKSIISSENDWGGEASYQPLTDVEKAAQQRADAEKWQSYNKANARGMDKIAKEAHNTIFEYIIKRTLEQLRKTDGVEYEFTDNYGMFTHYRSDYLTMMQDSISCSSKKIKPDTSSSNYVLFTNSNTVLKHLPYKDCEHTKCVSLLESMLKLSTSVYLSIESGSKNFHLECLDGYLKTHQGPSNITVIEPAACSETKRGLINRCNKGIRPMLSTKRDLIIKQLSTQDGGNPTKDMISGLKGLGFLVTGIYADLNPTGIDSSKAVFNSLVTASNSAKSTADKKAVVVIFGGERHAQSLNEGNKFIPCGEIPDAGINATVSAYLAKPEVKKDQVNVWKAGAHNSVWCISVYANNIPAAASVLDFGVFSGGMTSVEGCMANKKVFALAPSHMSGVNFSEDMMAAKHLTEIKKIDMESNEYREITKLQSMLSNIRKQPERSEELLHSPFVKFLNGPIPEAAIGGGAAAAGGSTKAPAISTRGAAAAVGSTKEPAIATGGAAATGLRTKEPAIATGGAAATGRSTTAPAKALARQDEITGDPYRSFNGKGSNTSGSNTSNWRR
jgi:hypothetical protein